MWWSSVLLGLLMVVMARLLHLLVVVATRLLWLFDMVLVVVSINGHWGGCCWVGVGFSFGGSSGDGFGREFGWWV